MPNRIHRSLKRLVENTTGLSVKIDFLALRKSCTFLAAEAELGGVPWLVHPGAQSYCHANDGSRFPSLVSPFSWLAESAERLDLASEELHIEGWIWQQIVKYLT